MMRFNVSLAHLLEDISQIVHASEILDKLRSLWKGSVSHVSSLTGFLLTRVLSADDLVVSHV